MHPERPGVFHLVTVVSRALVSYSWKCSMTNFEFWWPSKSSMRTPWKGTATTSGRPSISQILRRSANPLRPRRSSRQQDFSCPTLAFCLWRHLRWDVTISLMKDLLYLSHEIQYRILVNAKNMHLSWISVCILKSLLRLPQEVSLIVSWMLVLLNENISLLS